MKKLGRRLCFAVCLFGGSGLLFLLLFDITMPYLVEVDKVHVPALLNYSLPRARERLRRKGLRLGMRDTLYHETIPAGHIVDQTPPPRQQIKKGRRVFVDLSKGRRLYAVPVLRGVSLREARLQLEGTQLRLGRVAYQSSESFPAGVVVAQRPAAGARLPRHRAVDLYLSSGSSRKPKHIPDLSGLSIEVVEDTLRKYEMRLGAIRERLDNTVPAGIVLSQRPAPPARALRGTAVEVVLSVQQTPPPEVEIEAPAAQKYPVEN